MEIYKTLARELSIFGTPEERNLYRTKKDLRYKGKKVNGLWNGSEIILEEELSLDQRIETYVHERMHSIFDPLLGTGEWEKELFIEDVTAHVLDTLRSYPDERVRNYARKGYIQSIRRRNMEYAPLPISAQQAEEEKGPPLLWWRLPTYAVRTVLYFPLEFASNLLNAGEGDIDLNNSLKKGLDEIEVYLTECMKRWEKNKEAKERGKE